MGWIIGGVAVLGLLIWACIADSNEMARKQTAFMTACAADGRKPYDCNLQWATYAEAHEARQQAAAAAGMSAGAMASAGARR